MPIWQIITSVLVFLLFIILVIICINLLIYFFINKKLNIYSKNINKLLDYCFTLKSNILNIISKYMKSEKSLINRLNEIEEDYKKIYNINDKISKILLLFIEFSSIIAISEAYPNLIKESQFIYFKENLQETKNRLKLTINKYNKLLLKYNKLSNNILNKIIKKKNYTELIVL